MNVAIIPARGGSKRIPRKNIKFFCGKPMIAWSIETALASGCFDKVIVSTDDFEIASVAREYGAEVPFMRPHCLSDDRAGTLPVVQHAISWCRKTGYDVDLVCCLYATAPFVESEALLAGLHALENSDAQYAFSVTSYAFPIQRAIRITELGRVKMLNPSNFSIRSQDLEEIYHDAGQFYWGRTNAWVAGQAIFEEASIPIVLSRSRVQDIDTQEDWDRAELMFLALCARRDK